MPDNELLSVDDGVSKVVDADASLVAKEYYTNYAKYVLEYRALPGVFDGLKPVQRRIIYIANQQPKKLMKTAKLSGLVLSLHPHGSSSITGAINNMAYPLNNLPLFTTKGNFGSVNAPPSADRYTECYLSEIARKNFCQFVDYADYETGEIGEKEPSYLPSLIPYCLFEGCEGIAIGLSTKVVPLNLIDLIDYYIDTIKQGHSSLKIKPDVGYVLVENEDYSDCIKECRCRITTSSVVTQISERVFLIEGLYGKSIDSVIKKLDKYDGCFSKNQVGFRDASSTSLKYVFEIYDDKYDAASFKENLVWATRCNSSFTRVLEEDGSAVYSTLDYVVAKSLGALNKAIDKKISSELLESQRQLTIYEVLSTCKNKGIFDKITQMTPEELTDLIIRTTDCSQEVAREVIKKPISYLTRSHFSEEEKLRSQIEELNNHNRVEYLVSLYEDFKNSVLSLYESRKHTVSSEDMLKDPRIFLGDKGDIRVTEGEGLKFKTTVYFITDKSTVYPTTISTASASEILLSLDSDEKVIGLVTDLDNFVKLRSEFDYEGWYGCSVYGLSSLTYPKKLLNLREDGNERVVSVEGLDKLTSELEEFLKTKRGRSSFVKVQSEEES